MLKKQNDEMIKECFLFYIKLFSISEVDIKFSIKNIITKQPIEINIKGINIILTLSDKYLKDSSFSNENRNKKLENIFKEKN